ncbi:glycosyltransferase family protein [Botryobacter ruber]|uniref:glycosyltransferase family protein n=1 Tax=Botryobacter ruber TaxID=2171629 RepID=UPI000E0B417D|nr:glycosyltransferase [Botryobacter ruber]
MNVLPKLFNYLKSPGYLKEVLFFKIEKILTEFNIKKSKKYKLVILDDIFPHAFSAFRFIEFNYYLEQIDDLHVFTTGDALKSIHEEKNILDIIYEFSLSFPHHKGKISKFNHHQLISAELAYIVFSGNVLPRLEMLEKNNIPFVFTLYPGFGLRLDDPASDSDLRRIFTSPKFRKVIVTQKVVYDYLLKNSLCPEENIEFIYGVVLPCSKYLASNLSKELYPNHKITIDICFVANKQMEKGIDKGYDVFIAAAHLLAERFENIFFHVVGPYSEKDIDVSAISSRILFYGRLKTDEFPGFYSRMDLILSPNRSNILAKGAFDGFPTGACTEAGLNGVALFVADDLNQNIKFTNGDDIIIIEPTAEDIVKKVSYFYHNMEQLYTIAGKGKEKIIEIYKEEAQLKPRLNLLLNNIRNN